MMQINKIKNLILPSTGMKKASSATNLRDDSYINGDLPSHFNSLTLQQKNSFIKNQDVQSLCERSYDNEKRAARNMPDFIEDKLPTDISPVWLENAKDKASGQKLAAIHEFMTTELNYLRQLEYLLEVRDYVISSLQPVLFKTVYIDDIFINIGEIYECNFRFWNDYLYPSYLTALETKEPIDISSWLTAFKIINEEFKPYQKYCANMNIGQRCVQNLEKENKNFAKFLQWFSQHHSANRESLSDFLAKPFQRLTKYDLLLSTIKKNSQQNQEKICLDEMIQNIKMFIKNVDKKMTISRISMNLEPLDIVEISSGEQVPENMRKFDVLTPIKLGNKFQSRAFTNFYNFKLKEGQISRGLEVSVLIFTDILLICQKIKDFSCDKIKIIRPIIPLTHLYTSHHKHAPLTLQIVDNYNILIASYQLQGESEVIQKCDKDIQENKIHWTMLENASQQNQYSHYQSSNGHPRIEIDCSSPELLGSGIPSPSQISPSPLIANSSTASEAVSPRASSSVTGQPNKQSNIARSLSTNQFNSSFYRNSNKFSSPIVRRRNNTLSNKYRHESMMDRPKSDFIQFDKNMRCSSTIDLSSDFIESNNSSTLSRNYSSDELSPSIAEEPEDSTMLDHSHNSTQLLSTLTQASTLDADLKPSFTPCSLSDPVSSTDQSSEPQHHSEIIPPSETPRNSIPNINNTTANPMKPPISPAPNSTNQTRKSKNNQSKTQSIDFTDSIDFNKSNDNNKNNKSKKSKLFHNLFSSKGYCSMNDIHSNNVY